MGSDRASRIPEIMASQRDALLMGWVESQEKAGLGRAAELREPCGDLVDQIRDALQKGGTDDIEAPAWEGVRDSLESVARARSQRGSTPMETAQFVFSLRRSLIDQLRRTLHNDHGQLADEMETAIDVFDRLVLWTTEVHQQAREDVISRQQQEMLELSTPVVKLWDGILALPLIGTLDSSRSQIVMESLLQRIVETGSEVAIIDITGVPVVDTLVAHHLLKTVTAARLMGAECIISGIRPQIAQTIVHLGVDLNGVATKATLADALTLAIRRRGLKVSRVAGEAGTA